MIAIKIDEGQLIRLKTACERAGKKLKNELAQAIRAASKKTKIKMGRDIRETVAMKKEEAEKPLSIKADTIDATLQAVVRLKKTPRLGLRHFGAKQDKRGVSYKINKKGGRSRVDGAFTGPKPGAVRMKWKGNAFRRVGKTRLPIIQIKGVSAFGAYTKNNLTGPQVEATETELREQIERRINFNVLRASGLIKH